MTNLILPEYLAQKRAAENKEEAAADPGALSEAYVKPEERVLDPSRLPQTALGRLPQPTGWRILVLPYRGKGKSPKGLLDLPDEYVERMSLASVVAYVLAMGPDCYRGDKFVSGPWCKTGQWVAIGRYAGARFRIEGGEVRIINDDEVIAVIADPDDIKHV